jgi:hypothetical protein
MKIPYLTYTTFILIILILQILLFLFYDIYFLQASLEASNRFCENLQNSPNEPKKSLNSLICESKWKKDHFIWLNIDGLGWD